MSYTLLAHLFPRIRGSQEDIATYSLSYVLEQSAVLNESFTKLLFRKLKINDLENLQYQCQDADTEFGRPDIAGYGNGQIRVFCEAKFFAGLTENQPVGYLRRLQQANGKGLIFICPRERRVSLWDSLLERLNSAGILGEAVGQYCMDYNGIRLSILSWNEILEELLLVAADRAPEMIGDIHQIKGFCDKVESEAFIPFTPEDFSPRIARDIDRYYEVVDEVHKILCSHKELNPSTKGLRKSPRWQGYSQYLVLDGVAVSIDFIRDLWKSPSSVDTPFWCFIKEIIDGDWVVTDVLAKYLSTFDARMRSDFLGAKYIALIPKPYVSLEEVARDLSAQVIEIVQNYISYRDGMNAS